MGSLHALTYSEISKNEFFWENVLNKSNNLL